MDPVTVKLSRKPFRLFEMIECEVEFDDKYFHQNSRLGESEFHNAYDADENHSLFRADALVSSARGALYEIPVFACKKQKQSSWKWLIRFRPNEIGIWTLKVRVLCWHPDYPSSSVSEGAANRRSSSSGLTYWEHQFGFKDEDYRSCPSAKISFEVENSNSPGPLETPDRYDNKNYFYRLSEVEGAYERRPFFLFGLARPWVTEDRGWDNFLDREEELFKPMKDAGCNVLYHWMAPWETQLVHQSTDEFWFTSKGKRLTRTNDERPVLYRNMKLPIPSKNNGYKRYDQGRASHLDNIFDLAAKYDVQIFLSVMSHQSLQQSPHGWGEWSWDRLHYRETPDPSKVNGFQLFEYSDGIKIDDFFKMDPKDSSPYGSPQSWRRRLWKHFANYLRYVIARWTAHTAFGAWILIEELEGIGTNDCWWWENKDISYTWHDNVLSLMKGKLKWEAEGKVLEYTGDYLHHPITSSTTYYAADRSPADGDADALYKIDNAREYGPNEPHGTWMGGNRETIDFASHHAYHYVPTWGEWKELAEDRWEYVLDKKKEDSGTWVLPNTGGSERIKDDRWLWDSLCMRLKNWGDANSTNTRIITEYGCWERTKKEKKRNPEKWASYGKRYPTYAHFANWAAFVLGHAGIPFKWNDGKNFGEMASRKNSKVVWSLNNYPIDNYAEIVNVKNFILLSGANLGNLTPYAFRILGENGREDKKFNAWGLADSFRKSILVWIYDRTFSPKRRSTGCCLEIFGASESLTYFYKWFNTWSGTFISVEHEQVISTDKGRIIIPLPAFPVSSKDSVKDSGNDIAIVISVTK